MKILHTVEFYAPSTGGSQEVVKQISERMVKMGHEVTIATTKLPERKSKTINGVRIKEFDIRGNQVIGMSGEVDKYKKFLQNSDFDVVMNYAAQQWATDITFEVVDDIKAKKIIVPCGYSALHNQDFAQYFKRLPKILRKYSASIYLTKNYQDYKFARWHGVRHLKVIPNGADETEFQNLKPDIDFRSLYDINGFFILSVGNHTGSKGHKETLEVFKHFPYPATLVIIGKHQADGCLEECQAEANKINADGKNKKVLILTIPRAETIAALKSADVFLFLSNVEASPLVLFECAAAGLPFIATNVGNSKEIAQWTEGGLIVKSNPYPGRLGNVTADKKSSLDCLIKLYSDEKLRKSMGFTARQHWLNNFTWDKITERYLNVYQEALKK